MRRGVCQPLACSGLCLNHTVPREEGGRLSVDEMKKKEEDVHHQYRPQGRQDRQAGRCAEMRRGFWLPSRAHARTQPPPPAAGRVGRPVERPCEAGCLHRTGPGRAGPGPAGWGRRAAWPAPFLPSPRFAPAHKYWFAAGRQSGPSREGGAAATSHRGHRLCRDTCIDSRSKEI